MTRRNGHRAANSNGHVKVSDILDKMLLNETLGRTLTQNLNFNQVTSSSRYWTLGAT